jgi:hypothetical protein
LERLLAKLASFKQLKREIPHLDKLIPHNLVKVEKKQKSTGSYEAPKDMSLK